jgi:hypothetical protein
MHREHGTSDPAACFPEPQCKQVILLSFLQLPAVGPKGDVAFNAKHFVFSASEKSNHTYISVINEMPHS